MVSVRSFSLMKGLVLAMGMAGFSAGQGHGQGPQESKFTLHYEAHPKEAPSGRKGAFTGTASMSA